MSQYQTAPAQFQRLTAPITPACYSRYLLDELGFSHIPLAANDQRDAAVLWAASGAMALSGYADGVALHCRAPIAACAQGVWLALASLYPESFDTSFAAHRLLAERAALFGYSRQGRQSPGGACRLLDCADGTLALNLPRDEDFELLSAWLAQPAHNWQDLARLLPACGKSDLLERARLLGLACADIDERHALPSWFRCQAGAKIDRKGTAAPLVIDLSALWAGPLCGQILADSGAQVIKVESISRPDGARAGNADFYDLLNAGKRSVALDFSTESGRQQLQRLLSQADIVIESTRPRALEHMGIFAAEYLAARPGMLWLSITGYGREAPMRDWIAYGDDAGAAAGLCRAMKAGSDAPVFCGDAIADPLTGLHAALLILAKWYLGECALLEIALRDVAAHCAAMPNVQIDPAKHYEVAAPAARPVPATARPLGADTEAVLEQLSCR